MKWRLVFGYRHVSGIPTCPCADPGNYMTMEEAEADPLHARFTCWCGRKNEGTFDDEAERAAFLAANGAPT